MSRISKVGRSSLQNDHEFAIFAERMNETGRVFFPIAVKPGVVPPRILPPEDDEDVSCASDEWLDSCFREYIERRKSFETRYKSKKQFLIRLSLYTIGFLFILWAIWPVWDFFKMFFAVSSDDPLDEYYSTLSVSTEAKPQEIKKAYRDAIRKWHPDNNPQCGDYCKDQVIKIQKAHDVLLSRGDQRFVLAKIESERANEIRSFILFRMYQMAGSSAKQLNAIITLLIGHHLRGSEAQFVGIGCNLFTFLFFTLFEVTHFGANWVTLLQLGYHVLSVIKPNAEKFLEEKAIRASHIDLARETLMTIIPVSIFYLGSFFINAGTVVETVMEMTFGCLYILAFLNRFTPNIRDNIVMRKCSISHAYLSQTAPRVTLPKFIFTEIGFMLDDLFVHTAGISFFPRVVVYLIHFLYVFQMVTLPLDLPVSFRRKKKASHVDEVVEEIPHRRGTVEKGFQPSEKRKNRVESPVEESVSKSWETNTDGREAAESLTHTTKEYRTTEPLKAESSFYDVERTLPPPPPSQPLSKEEIAMFANLDKEGVLWIDIPYLKYGYLNPKGKKANSKDDDGSEEMMALFVTSDLQRLAVMHVTKSSTGQHSNPKFVRLVHDPDMCRIIAIDGGPDALRQLKGGNQLTPLPPNFYQTLFGPVQHKLTNSQIWRYSVDIYQSRLFSYMELGGIVLAFFCTLVFIMLTSPSMITILRSTKELQSTQKPHVYQRFVPYLPEEHILNHVSAGLLTVRKEIALITPDFWDAVRQLHKLTAAQQKQKTEK